MTSVWWPQVAPLVPGQPCTEAAKAPRAWSRRGYGQLHTYIHTWDLLNHRNTQGHPASTSWVWSLFSWPQHRLVPETGSMQPPGQDLSVLDSAQSTLALALPTYSCLLWTVSYSAFAAHGLCGPSLSCRGQRALSLHREPHASHLEPAPWLTA